MWMITFSTLTPFLRMAWAPTPSLSTSMASMTCSAVTVGGSGQELAAELVLVAVLATGFALSTLISNQPQWGKAVSLAFAVAQAVFGGLWVGYRLGQTRGR